jgi:putative transposase
VSVDGLRWGVQPICKVLTEHGVPIAPSTYYASLTRPASPRSRSDELMLVEIGRVFAASGKRYGADKVWWKLNREGITVARCTVERLMRVAGLHGVLRRKGHLRTTTPDPKAVRPPDLVKRDFTASRPDELWVVDFTYVRTYIGFVFTAFVTDVFSRRLIGWRTFDSMPTELPLDALEMAVWIRAGHDLTGLVHHSDAGSQYTSFRYTERLTELGALASIGTVGDSYDNALAETTIGLYKAEVIHHQGPWRGANDVELATAMWVDWFNTERLHGSIGRIPPVEFENNWHTAQRAIGNSAESVESQAGREAA